MANNGTRHSNDSQFFTTLGIFVITYNVFAPRLSLGSHTGALMSILPTRQGGRRSFMLWNGCSRTQSNAFWRTRALMSTSPTTQGAPHSFMQ
ncbi:hypothetical protein CC1G_14912 [Coprinopsis cinerea okayama7|uniref:Uncharacterized protein n=1 Tax=Coprinopsis cinerea (strain Okayama-7 / 130 / ATCC MYA-4618 / FGSC 9003) TaxID=240176 RepID=D6RNS5_COPC7|nr:hypothetical protein CC1G_14912 [Coprinopsis cinerea okayama7\|eukprot:XP_002910935.1 hypothetical protein CC1G_14912 [Coprinopsis cinerea okayama7\